MRIQLPDFQRGYKWDDDRNRQLLVAILRGHPLGVVMLLQTGNDQIRFKPRPVEGVTLTQPVEPDRLLLDGQQRLTSLTQALTGDGVVRTDFGEPVELDLSDAAKERRAGYFPVRLLFGTDTLGWLFELDKDEARQFHECVIKPATTYTIPAIQLDTATSKSAVATRSTWTGSVPTTSSWPAVVS